MYLIVRPRINVSGSFQKRSPFYRVSSAAVVGTAEVWMTSTRCTFIQTSQFASVPLKVSPFFSSTN